MVGMPGPAGMTTARDGYPEARSGEASRVARVRGNRLGRAVLRSAAAEGILELADQDLDGPPRPAGLLLPPRTLGLEAGVPDAGTPRGERLPDASGIRSEERRVGKECRL